MSDDLFTTAGLVMPSRVYVFRYGPLEVTVGPDVRAWAADIYHAGDAVLRPRFVCTGAEGLAVGQLAQAAADLADNYLAHGRGFDQWCRDRRIDPARPDLAVRDAAGPLRLASRR
jgi:hypothetical protein